MSAEDDDYEDYDYEDYQTQRAVQQLDMAIPRLKEMISLINEAAKATTAKQAEDYVLQMELVDAELELIFSGVRQPRNIREAIQNRQGDFAKLTDLFIKLGVIR